MQKVWKWLAGIGSALAAIAAFLLWRKHQKDHVNTLKDAVVVAKAERKVSELNGRRSEVDKRTAARTDEISDVDLQLEENQRKIVEARTGARNLSREQVLEEYRRLGYL